MSVLERCPSYRDSNKGSKEKQGPTLGVRFTEVSVKRELTVENLTKSIFSDPCQLEVEIYRSQAVLFIQIFGQIVSIRAKTFSNTNLEESRHFKREKKSLLVDMLCSKAPSLKLPNNNITLELRAISAIILRPC